MTFKTIIIENRRARTTDEKRLYGETLSENHLAHIFINSDRNRQGIELVDTIFHELAHAVIALYANHIPKSKEEKLCRRMGKLAAVEFSNV
jgi:hypothetical protein